MVNTQKLSAVLVAVAFVGGLYATKSYQHKMEKEVPQAKAPYFEDVNGDGIEDKIIEQRVYVEEYLYVTVPELQKTVLYGIGEVNGKRRYLPRGVFEEWNKE